MFVLALALALALSFALALALALRLLDLANLYLSVYLSLPARPVCPRDIFVSAAT